MTNFENKIVEILGNYSKSDTALVRETIDELCKNGIEKGCFQDYAVICDLISILGAFENAVSEKEE